jgi:hypothetical protein
MWTLLLKATTESYFEFPAVSNTNMADERICDVGATLAPLHVWIWNELWQDVSYKYVGFIMAFCRIENKGNDHKRSDKLLLNFYTSRINDI